LGKTAMIAYFASGAPAAATGRSYLPDLIVLPIENPTQAKQLLEKAKSQKATHFVERTYKGVEIRETQKKQLPELFSSCAGAFLCR